jgi:hypothetical protein
MATLQDMTTMSHDQLIAEIARLKAKVSAKATAKLAVKVKPLGGKDEKGNAFKGNVAVYGLGRYPVTLYPSQWIALSKVMADVLEAIEDNRDDLSWKDED